MLDRAVAAVESITCRRRIELTHELPVRLPGGT
jgi:hypothetical protein